ncbi:acyl-CoA N-acyltransferase [Lojkania enalia]|uniref:Acyl-CoA N-acyltransferase n=1 Tax=Lojkania enalia TaxID=147567 RepID=A0A9P4K0N6_9PLEO|nr:acyl-CoA N-acyltransferase [Didymosphaeria enalia]
MVIEATPSHPATMAAQLSSTPLTLDSPLPDPIITTPRLIIRPMHPQDAPSMQKYAAPASITTYMSLAFAHPYTLDHANNWINTNLAAQIQNNFCICETSVPDISIGGIGIKPGSDVQAHTAEVGYWIGEPFWGKGYITEALRAMTDWVFTARGEQYRRLSAKVFSGNTASMRCLVKCGYREEGVLRGDAEKHGKVYDSHVFGLTKGDWEELKRSEEVE